MRTTIKLVFLLSVFIVLNACFLKPKVKVTTTARVLNPTEMPEALTALENRMEKFNVSAIISQLNGTDIRMEILTDEGVQGLKRNLLASTELEFYEVFSGDWIKFELIDRFVEKDGSYPEIMNKIENENIVGSPIAGFVKSKDTTDVMTFLNSFPLLNFNKFPANQLRLNWGVVDDNGRHPLYVLKTNDDGLAEMSGDLIEDAMQTYDQAGGVCVSIEMSKTAAIKWERFTGRAAKEQFQIAIVLDGLVYSAPGVTSAIPGGSSSISGDFSIEEAQRIAEILKLGDLPKMELVSFDIVND